MPQGDKDRKFQISVQKCLQRSNLQWQYINKIHVMRTTIYVTRSAKTQHNRANLNLQRIQWVKSLRISKKKIQ